MYSIDLFVRNGGGRETTDKSECFSNDSVIFALALRKDRFVR